MKWRENNGTLIAEGTVAEDGTYTITGNRSLATGTHYLWIALDIDEAAQEGNTVDATLTLHGAGLLASRSPEVLRSASRSRNSQRNMVK